MEMEKLITILTTSSLSLLLTPASWGESLSNSTPVSRSGSTTVLPQKKLPILKSFSTSATDLIDVAQSVINSDQQEVDRLEEAPERGQFNLGLGDSDKPILFGFGILQSEPTVLKGFTREPVEQIGMGTTLNFKLGVNY